MPKLSVVVPIYNVENYIRDCVESLQNQTLKDIEIILVDDGSPDNCGRIIDEYAAGDDRIKVIHKPNGGVSAARNDGLKAVSGEYVLFCDSDDMMEPDAFEKLYKAGSENDADVVVGDVYRIINGEKKYTRFFAKPFCTDDRKILDELVKVDFIRKYCHDAPAEGPAFGYGGPWNKAVKRSFLEKAGICFDTSLKGIFDDILYTAYLYAEAKKVVYITEPVYDYRILEGSVTHSYKAEMVEINKAIFAAWNKFLNKYGKDGRFDRAYDALVIRRLKGMLGTYFFNEKNPMSLKQQKQQLKALFKTEPYKSAVKKVDPHKLINQYDLAVWTMAKAGSANGLHLVYKTFVFLKK
ncbi:MAG: glycosyltransferase [Clostridiales bacterium]|nr:glycosyltransferase [Clostridiales bacterium]